MDERVLQARVGIVVISALLLTAILIVLFGDVPDIFRGGKTISVTFPTAPGVSEGTPVRKSGILIGRVEKVDFAPDSSDVVVRLRMDDITELRKNEVCRITSGSLLGDAVLEFVPGGEPSNEIIPDGANVRGVAGRNPLDLLSGLEGDLRKTLTSMSKAGEEVSRMADNMSGMVEGQDRDQVRRVLTKTEQAMDSFYQTMTRVDSLFPDDDTQNSLRQTLEGLPEAIRNTERAMDSVRVAAERADRNLRNLEGLTGPLGERGAAIVDQIDSSVGQFEEITEQLLTFTKRINSEEGSLGQLLSDPQLYNNVNKTVTRIERLSRDLEPILDDVRVFTDKIARDPGRLGVSGALRRNSNTKFPDYGYVEPPPLDWRDDLRPPLDWHNGH